MDILESKFMEGFKRLTADAFKKGWHERNGGNLTYRVKPEEVEAVKESLHEVKAWQPIGNTVPGLAGEYFLVTGSGKYMRNVSLAPEENVALIRSMRRASSTVSSGASSTAAARRANCRRISQRMSSRKR